MLDSILLQPGAITLSLTPASMFLCSIVSIVLGLVIAGCYMLCSEKYTKNYVITLAVLPILVQVVIMMVNGNLGTGVAILGAFSLVRFRSVPGNSKEIGVVFFAMAIGLATGMGYLGYAVAFTLIVSVLFVVLSKSGFGEKKESLRQLRVTIPENLNYEGLFSDLFDKYLVSVSLEKVKTTNLGSMFELTYYVKVKNGVSEKEMIDEIRTRNGNLTVCLGRISPDYEEL